MKTGSSPRRGSKRGCLPGAGQENPPVFPPGHSICEHFRHIPDTNVHSADARPTATLALTDGDAAQTTWLSWADFSVTRVQSECPIGINVGACPVDPIVWAEWGLHHAVRTHRHRALSALVIGPLAAVAWRRRAAQAYKSSFSWSGRRSSKKPHCRGA